MVISGFLADNEQCHESKTAAIKDEHYTQKQQGNYPHTTQLLQVCTNEFLTR